MRVTRVVVAVAVVARLWEVARCDFLLSCN